MADYITVRLEGGEELARYLKEIGFDLAKKRFLTALRAGARVIVPAMKAAAPRSDHDRTYGGKPHKAGTMADSITTQKTKVRNDERVSLAIGPAKNAFYALHGEVGTRHEPGTHWAANTLIATADAATEKIQASLDRAFKKYNRRKRG